MEEKRKDMNQLDEARTPSPSDHIRRSLPNIPRLNSLSFTDLMKQKWTHTCFTKAE